MAMFLLIDQFWVPIRKSVRALPMAAREPAEHRNAERSGNFDMVIPAGNEIRTD